MSVHAVIIAGGAGSRLGNVRKGDLRVGGRRLLERVAQALGPIDGLRLVAHGLHPVPMMPEGFVPVRDLGDSFAGPLAGLAAAALALREFGGDDVLITVAVDTPFLPPDYVACLTGAAQGATAAYAAWGPNFYPTNGAWRLSALADLPETIGQQGSERSPKALQRRLDAVRVDWAGRSAVDPFSNVNTVADLLALQKRVLG